MPKEETIQLKSPTLNSINNHQIIAGKIVLLIQLLKVILEIERTDIKRLGNPTR